MQHSSNPVIGLTDETLNQLRELRRLCVDSSKGFEECAELTEKVSLQTLFLAIAEERRDMDEALAKQIEFNDGAEEEMGSYLAAWHRAWIRVREAASGADEVAILSEAERGEDSIKSAYEDALEGAVGSPIQPLIYEQYVKVKAAHDSVRDLRDAAKAKA